MTPRAYVLRALKLCLGALLLMVLVAVGTARAGKEKAGTTAANFLSVGTGPRALSMGGATLGLGDDVAAAAWNPAALGWVGTTTLVLAHSSLGNETTQEWLAAGGRFGRSGSRWSVSGLYQGDGSIEGRDASDVPTGSIDASSFAVGVHLAHALRPDLSVGLGMKSVNEQLAGASGSGFTFDAGMKLRRGMLGAGFAAQNVGGQMRYSSTSYPFPASYGLGVSLSHPTRGLSLAVDANFPSAYYGDLRLGGEWRWKETLALRSGYRHEIGASDDPLTGPSFGLGAGSNGFWLDYGYLVSGNGSGEHRMALTFVPGRWSGFGSDPFGQGDMRREFDTPPLVGPPAPKETGKKK